MVNLYYMKMLVHKPTYFYKLMIKDFRVYLTLQKPPSPMGQVGFHNPSFHHDWVSLRSTFIVVAGVSQTVIVSGITGDRQVGTGGTSDNHRRFGSPSGAIGIGFVSRTPRFVGLDDALRYLGGLNQVRTEGSPFLPSYNEAWQIRIVRFHFLKTDRFQADSKLLSYPERHTTWSIPRHRNSQKYSEITNLFKYTQNSSPRMSLPKLRELKVCRLDSFLNFPID